MSLIPTYDPKSFASVDLRKYHIRDIKDVIKFHEFVASRMEECQYILKKFNVQMATFKTITAQLQRKQEAQQATYGAGHQVTEPTQDNSAKIETVEDNSLQKQHEELLDDIKSAVAEENLAEAIEDKNEPLQAILGKYKIIYGKKGAMFYRENEDGRVKLVSKKDVPEDIKQQLLASVGKEE